jgi:creatinine deaminase
MTTREQDQKFMDMAFEQAQKSYDEGGLPIGAAMVEKGKVLAVGHNKRVQEVDPIAHGEMDCLRQAGRRRSYKTVTLYTTLSPCMMCAGTIVQFGIKRVVIGEDENFSGNIEFLKSRGVEIDVLSDKRCIELMARLIREKPQLWNEDIAVE